LGYTFFKVDLMKPEAMRNKQALSFTEAGSGVEEFTGEGAEKVFKTYLRFSPKAAEFRKDYGTWGDK